MAVHILKTFPNEFADIDAGRKKFEVRSNVDRRFELGDRIYLVRQVSANRAGKLDPNRAPIRFILRHLLRGGSFGVPETIDILSVGNRLLRYPPQYLWEEYVKQHPELK